MRPWNGEESPDWFLSPVSALNRDLEADELVALALRVQAAPPLQVDPDFARQLEQRILLRNAALHLERPVRGWSFLRLLPAQPVFRVTLGLCLLLLLLGTGALIVAAQAYREALVELDQQLNAASRAINALPAGAAHDRVESQLATLQAAARHTLRGLLLQLALPERLLTTDELGRLSDTVPHLVSAEIVLPAHPDGQAVISIAGDDLQPGAQLLVDSRLVNVRGSLQNGWYVFVASWAGNQHPQSIGILNPDGTAAQTTTIMLNSSDDHGNGNGNGDRKP